jgi:anti-sigma factor RsiW
VLDWSDISMHYWAVSDLGATDLDGFAKAFRDADPE